MEAGDSTGRTDMGLLLAFFEGCRKQGVSECTVQQSHWIWVRVLLNLLIVRCIPHCSTSSALTPSLFSLVAR